MKSNAGFTLIEVLIAMCVSMFIMASAYSVFLSQQKSTTAQTSISDIQQNLRAAMDFLTRDIRVAGYAGPNNGAGGNFGFVDVLFHDFDGVTQNPNGNSFLQFSWDMNDNGTRDAGETVSYSLSDTSVVALGSNALMRQLDSGGGRQPMAGFVEAMGLAFAYDFNQDGELDRDAAGNIVWAVDSGHDGDWDSLDTNGDGQIDVADLGGGASGVIAGSDTGTPLRYQDIRAVRIWLLGRSENPDSAYTNRNTYVVGRDVIQPNDKFRRRLLERTVLCRNMGLKL